MPETQRFERSILIIDSSFLIIERLTNILKDVDEVSEIYKATGFEEAVEILKERKINIVLLDIQLPGKNGIELLKFIVQSFPEIKVVVVTNQVSVYYQRLCKTLGAVSFIDKSRDFDLIPEMVSVL